MWTCVATGEELDERRTLLPSRHFEVLCRELGGSTVHAIGGNVLPRKMFFLASLILVYKMTMKYLQDRTANLIVWVAVV